MFALNRSGPLLGRKTRVFVAVVGGGLFLASPFGAVHMSLVHGFSMFSVGLIALYSAWTGRDRLDPRPPEALGPDYRAALKPREVVALMVLALVVGGLFCWAFPMVFGFC